MHLIALLETVLDLDLKVTVLYKHLTQAMTLLCLDIWILLNLVDNFQYSLLANSYWPFVDPLGLPTRWGSE